MHDVRVLCLCSVCVSVVSVVSLTPKSANPFQALYRDELEANCVLRLSGDGLRDILTDSEPSMGWLRSRLRHIFPGATTVDTASHSRPEA